MDIWNDGHWSFRNCRIYTQISIIHGKYVNYGGKPQIRFGMGEYGYEFIFRMSQRLPHGDAWEAISYGNDGVNEPITWDIFFCQCFLVLSQFISKECSSPFAYS